MKQIVRVKGMHCHSCEILLTDSLQELPGVKAVKVSQKDSQVVVEFDEKKVSLDAIKAKIKEEKYTVG
ncbi:heavy-metal-associated domain-containing protein [Candidatus Woesearchaeota archaeon]|nr:heavy-metal-associated domain-containing protein [Candidatus Woesearchaeota archaeon]